MDFVGELTRRRLLQSASYGVALSSIALIATPAAAIGSAQGVVEIEDVSERAAAPKPRMNISVPDAIHDFQSVPITVSLENRNFEQASVQAIYILADGASRPELARLYPMSRGETVQVSSKVSMGEARRIWAVAKLTDGSVCMAVADLPA